jgi:hypothetical protein
MLGDITETATNNGVIKRKGKKEKPTVKCQRLSKHFPDVCNKCIKCLLMNMSAKEQVNCKKISFLIKS